MRNTHYLKTDFLSLFHRQTIIHLTDWKREAHCPSVLDTQGVGTLSSMWAPQSHISVHFCLIRGWLEAVRHLAYYFNFLAHQTPSNHRETQGRQNPKNTIFRCWPAQFLPFVGIETKFLKHYIFTLCYFSVFFLGKFIPVIEL